MAKATRKLEFPVTFVWMTWLTWSSSLTSDQIEDAYLFFRDDIEIYLHCLSAYRS